MERTVEPGKWRIGMEGGSEILRVWIKGMRNRPHELNRVSKDEFYSYTRKFEHKMGTDSVLLRGTPSMFTTEGHIVCIYPAPMHEWKMQFEIRK